MDLFYDSCHIEKKQRVHFHQFMLDVHQRIRKVKDKITTYDVKKDKPYDPIPPVAADICDETWLLCFDEFQVCGLILRQLVAYMS